MLKNLKKLWRGSRRARLRYAQLAELRAACEGLAPAAYAGTHSVQPPGNGARLAPPVTVADVPMYQVDALVRRAISLQRTRDGRTSLSSY